MLATGYFDLNDARVEEEIPKDKVIVTKDKCGINGSKEYGEHHYMATTTLDVKFSVAEHFVPTSCEGEVNSGNTQQKSIQVMFCGNTDTIKAFKEHCDKSD